MVRYLLFIVFLHYGILFAQDKSDYILTTTRVEIDSSIKHVIDNYVIDTSSSFSLIFFYGYNYQMAIILKLKDSINVESFLLNTEGQLKNTIIQNGIDSLYIYLNKIQNEHFSLFTENLSTSSNGYRYYIFKKDELIGSFYSHHNLKQYKISEIDESRLKLLKMLLSIFKIE